MEKRIEADYGTVSIAHPVTAPINHITEFVVFCVFLPSAGETEREKREGETQVDISYHDVQFAGSYLFDLVHSHMGRWGPHGLILHG